MVSFPFKDVKRSRVTCEYGRKGKWSSGLHDGIDLVCDGDKGIYSCTDGKVIRSGVNPYLGEYIVVELSDGRALIYGHLLNNSRKVMAGEIVKEGTLLATMGNTGDSTGAHLHLELQQKYYKPGRVDDISRFLGIENVVGKVTELTYENKDIYSSVPQWQSVACEQVCQQFGMDQNYWKKKVENQDQVLMGELFGLLNKINK